ncbi:HAMP domain-containing histidine kinase [Sphingomonas sp. JC676]|uniref:HAMP domain-containing sensor histidine kinase n=1 Tax=Sphingomonas sp. JC676 TaxID=2768065 RepID=UPI001657B0E3|nr:HAMP domain-containing sensor histidine kinase [Sphingomonas sp. JC676]MBC9033769.1 HAMP domain-containing histidine kinase [Sphingomonas sp. JC676]
MPKLPSSTAFRFAAFYSLAFTLLILALGAAMYWAIRSELRYDLDQRVTTERGAVLREAAAGGLARVVAERARHEQGDMRYALLGASGRLLAGRRIVRTPLAGWVKMDFLKDNGEPDDTRAFVSATADGGLLIVGADPEAIEDLDERMIPMFAIAFGLIAAIGIAGAFLLSRALRRRLDSINRTAHAIIGGDMSRRMKLTGGGDEFDRLSATLNLMLDRIAGLLDNLRQVSGDIAHDLRTPIARLRQKLDLTLAAGGGEAELREAMRHAIAQTEDMLELFAAILSISEVEAGGGARMAPLDLSALIADLADSYQPSAEDSGRQLLRDIAPNVMIDGNRELLAQLMVNLLDNALNHTPNGAAIGISLDDGEAVTLTISDAGPGIPETERERVFARFTRLERSRTTPGHGLGLALVAAIVRAHGGSVTLEDNHPGVKAMVTFPRRPN